MYVSMEIFDSKNIIIFDELIEKSSQIVISTHINPDGDAAGSSLGLLSYLKGRGKKATVIFPTPMPENLNFMIPEELRHDILIREETRGRSNGGSHSTVPLGDSAWPHKESENSNGTQGGEEACRRAISCADLLISVDYNSISRSGKVEDNLTHFSGKKVLIDHHLAPDVDYYDLIFSTEYISSASEAVFWILHALYCSDGNLNNPDGMTGNDETYKTCKTVAHDSLNPLSMDCKNDRAGSCCSSGHGFPDKTAGTLLMTGMTTDTNNFANSTFPSTLEMAKILLAAGIDRDGIIDNLYKRYRENRFRLLGYVLSQKLTITGHGAAIVLLTSDEMKKFDIRDGETEGFVNIPLEISEVRLSILIKEDADGHFRVSLRSKRGTSANRCSQMHFHGGGHELASGGHLTIPEDASDIDSLLEYAKTSADKFLADNPISIGCSPLE